MLTGFESQRAPKLIQVEPRSRTVAVNGFGQPGSGATPPPESTGGPRSHHQGIANRIVALAKFQIVNYIVGIPF